MRLLTGCAILIVSGILSSCQCATSEAPLVQPMPNVELLELKEREALVRLRIRQKVLERKRAAGPGVYAQNEIEEVELDVESARIQLKIAEAETRAARAALR